MKLSELKTGESGVIVKVSLALKSYAEVKPDFAKQSLCKPNAERRELALKSYAEVKPDFAKQSLCKPNAERRELALKSYAEVKPDFAKQSLCKSNAERWEFTLKSYAEVQPDFAEGKKQHANTKIQILERHNIEPQKFSTPSKVHSALYLSVFFHVLHTKKRT